MEVRSLLYVSSLIIRRKPTLIDYSDNAHGRILDPLITDHGLTVEICIQNCSSQNFTLAGMEFAGTMLLSMTPFLL